MRHARQRDAAAASSHARTRSETRHRERRQQLAAETARLLAEGGLRDFHQAKRKAAERLGVFDADCLPRNHEIEQALRDYQRLFLADSQPDEVRRRRVAAIRALEFFAPFQPRLVGAVLEGIADAHTAICLHLHSDDPQAVSHYLLDHDIPLDARSRRLRLDRHRSGDFPVWVFSADDLPFDVTVLPLDTLRQAPLDRGGERPMQRASLSAVRQLVELDIA